MFAELPKKPRKSLIIEGISQVVDTENTENEGVLWEWFSVTTRTKS